MPVLPISHRLACLLGFLACAGFMAYALYAQHGLGLEPCPLCIFQRMAMIATGLVFLAGAIHGPARLGQRIYSGLALLAAAIGAGIAGHHVRLQAQPADLVPSCGPGFDYLMETFPLSQALRMIFQGRGDCTEVDWTFLGLSMPAWVLICFIGLALWSLLALRARR